MKTKKDVKDIVEMLEVISRLDKRRINKLIYFIERNWNNLNEDINVINKKNEFHKIDKTIDSKKIDIIGGLPFLLLSKKYFNTTNDIKNFSIKYLNFKIPKGNKSRPEIIGIIVTHVVGLPKSDTEEFRSVLNEVIYRAQKGTISDVFLEWEKTIKSLKFRK